MVTSTNNIGTSGWSNIIGFINSIVGSLDIDNGLARVGLVMLVSFTYNFLFI